MDVNNYMNFNSHNLDFDQVKEMILIWEPNRIEKLYLRIARIQF